MYQCPSCGAAASEGDLDRQTCSKCGFQPAATVVGLTPPPLGASDAFPTVTPDAYATQQRPGVLPGVSDASGALGAPPLPSDGPIAHEPRTKDVPQTQGVPIRSPVPPPSQAPPFPADDRYATQPHLEAVWGASLRSSAAPNETVRAAPSTPASSTTGVSIRPRDVIEAKRPDGDAKVNCDYELLGKLGEGGMGVVYAARQTAVDRTIAIKMLKPDQSRDAKARAEFLAEAAVTSDLEHPNIVPIHDLGGSRSGTLFYAMKRVQGEPWSKLIGQKSLAENLDILLRIADAVAFAHSRGVIHRDLKPENVMLGGFGEVLVMDWGLAAAIRPESKASVMSAGAAGTPAYMAPEMARGLLDAIGPASDVYLLGALLFEICTGRPPHTGRNVQECLFNAAVNKIVPVEESSELLEIAAQAMATNPADRYASATEFQAAVRLYQSHSESLLLSARAEEHFAVARASSDYDRFAQALFGFREALALWDGNVDAREGVVQAPLEYARSAAARDDLDLAASLLSADIAEHRPLALEIAARQAERQARARRLGMYRRAAQSLAAVLVITLSIAVYWIRSEAQRAHERELDAIAAKNFAQGESRRAEAAAQTARERAAEVEQANQRNQKLLHDASQADYAVAAQRLEMEGQWQTAVAHLARALEWEPENRLAAIRLWTTFAQPGRLPRHPLQHVFMHGNVPATKFDLSPDGQIVLTAAPGDRAIRLWDVTTCQPFGQPLVHDRDVLAGQFSVDGKTIATLTADQSVWLWDARTFRNRAGPILHPQAVSWLRFSPDGKRIVSMTRDPANSLAIGSSSIRLWNVETGAALGPPLEHGGAIRDAAFSPDSRWLATACEDRHARLWEAASGRLLHTLSHAGIVGDVTFSPDSQRVLSASEDQTARQWDVESGQPFGQPLRLEGTVAAAEYSPDGAKILALGRSVKSRLWNASTCEPIGEPMEHIATTAHFSPDGTQFVTAGSDGAARLWDASTARPRTGIMRHGGFVSAYFSPDSRLLATTGADADVMVWNADDGERVGQLLHHRDPVWFVRFTAHGSRAIVQTQAGHVLLYEVALGLPDGEPIRSIVTDRILSFSRDGRRVLVDALGPFSVHELDSGKQLATFGQDRKIKTAALSPGGDYVALAEESVVEVRSVATGQIVGEPVRFPRPISYLTFSPDGQLLLIASGDGSARLTEPTTGRLHVPALDCGGFVLSAGFRPDGQEAATVTSSGHLRIWNVATGEGLDELPHPEGFTDVSYHPAGTQIVTTAEDGLLRVWDARSHALVFPAIPGGFKQAVFSHDGRRILAVNAQSEAWVLDAVTGDRVKLLWNNNDAVVHCAASPLAPIALTYGANEIRLWDLTTYRQLGEPLWSEFFTEQAWFRPESLDIVSAASDQSPRIWRFHTPLHLPDAVPPDFLDWAIGMAGLRFNADGALEDLEPTEIARRLRIAVPGDGPWARLQRWQQTPRERRTMHPDATKTLRTLAEIERDLEGGPAAYELALTYDPATPLVRLKLAAALEAADERKSPENRDPSNTLAVNFLRRYSLDHLPPEPRLWLRAAAELALQPNAAAFELRAAQRVVELDPKSAEARAALQAAEGRMRLLPER